MKGDRFCPAQCCLVNCIAVLDRRPCSCVQNAPSWILIRGKCGFLLQIKVSVTCFFSQLSVFKSKTQYLPLEQACSRCGEIGAAGSALTVPTALAGAGVAVCSPAPELGGESSTSLPPQTPGHPAALGVTLGGTKHGAQRLVPAVPPTPACLPFPLAARGLSRWYRQPEFLLEDYSGLCLIQQPTISPFLS